MASKDDMISTYTNKLQRYS